MNKRTFVIHSQNRATGVASDFYIAPDFKRFTDLYNSDLYSFILRCKSVCIPRNAGDEYDTEVISIRLPNVITSDYDSSGMGLLVALMPTGLRNAGDTEWIDGKDSEYIPAYLAETKVESLPVSLRVQVFNDLDVPYLTGIVVNLDPWRIILELEAIPK